MNAPASNPASKGTAKGNALKTFAVNFILAFAGYVTYQAGKEYYQNRKAKVSKP
jgi:hypothetical protein